MKDVAQGAATADAEALAKASGDARAAQRYELTNGAVVIAAITSCTNTATRRCCSAPACWRRRPSSWAQRSKPWVKTSLAPGSQVVTDYLTEAGLMPYLEALGFHVVGYGCTTCIGNSGPLPTAGDRRDRDQIRHRARPR